MRVSLVVGVAAGLFVTRRAGREFRPLVETLVAIGQTVPPVAVLALAVPLIGFGALPALIALALYGLLPIVRGDHRWHRIGAQGGARGRRRPGADAAGNGCCAVELPLALPVLSAGVRSSVIINIGTAAIASTVGARTLGSPIIVGLAGFNTAYVLQGAVVVALVAVVVDLGFERLGSRWGRWRATV